MTEIRTDRLLLRPVRVTDIDRILEYRNLPAVSHWLLRTVVDPDAFREAWRSAGEDPDDHSVAVLLGDLVIGTVSFELTDGMGQPGMPTRTEGQLGYIFDPAYAGHGYATEAVSAVLARAFDELLRRQHRLGTSPGEGRHATRAARRRGLLARRPRLGRRSDLRDAR